MWVLATTFCLSRHFVLCLFNANAVPACPFFHDCLIRTEPLAWSHSRLEAGVSCPVSSLSQGPFPAASGQDPLRLGRKESTPAATSLPAHAVGHQQLQAWQGSEAIVCTQRDHLGGSHHEREPGYQTMFPRDV